MVTKKEINKKGQDLSIGTLILIVLGVIVLVLLILGFSLGWSNLWEKINIFGGSNSIGDVATACSLAVSSQNTYDFCQNFRQVKVDGKTEYLNCEDTRIQIQGQKLDCSSQAIRDSNLQRIRSFCFDSNNQTKTDVKVNGLDCSTYSLL